MPTVLCGGREGEPELGCRRVGARDEHRLAVLSSAARRARPKPPMPASTSGRGSLRAKGLIRPDQRVARLDSTPASRSKEPSTCQILRDATAALGISQGCATRIRNFIAGRNAERWRACARCGRGARRRIVYLWGEAGSGRHHLLRRRRALNPACRARRRRDARRRRQQALFVAINRRRGGPVGVAAGAKPPAQLEFRADLRTAAAWGWSSARAARREDKARHLKSSPRARLQLSDDIVGYSSDAPAAPTMASLRRSWKC